jgi:CheY-like chemotaxis protein
MEKILIAEDSSVIQNIAKKILEFQGFEIVSAKNGKEVLQKLNEDIKIILMDINMPQMDGIECAKQIRTSENPIIANLPIIAITGNAKNYALEDYQKIGINDFVPKPLDFDLLIETIKKYV